MAGGASDHMEASNDQSVTSKAEAGPSASGLLIAVKQESSQIHKDLCLNTPDTGVVKSTITLDPNSYTEAIACDQ